MTSWRGYATYALALGLFAFDLAGTARSVAPAPVTIRIGVIPSDFSGEPYYGKAEGFFAQHGLNAEITGINNGGIIASAIVSGSLDVGYDSIVQLALAVDKGIPLTILAPAYIYQDRTATTGLLSVAANSGITSAKDLDGKTIAVGGLKNITQLAVEAWIDKHGGDSTTVHYIEVPASEFAATVRSGRVAAAPMDSSLDPLLGQPGDSLRLLGKTFGAVAPTYLAGAWVATPDWIAKHPVEARAFVAAIVQTARWANTHHDRTAQILAKQLEVDPQQVERYPRVAYATTVSPQAVQPSIDVAARYHFIQAAFPAREMISASAP